MLQTISPDLLPFITTVINGSLTSGHVPTAFKKARVIPILKKPALDPSDISNYRPVSLLSFLSKVLKRVVCNQLSDYLLQNNLHDPNQSGFKAAHSTETALLAVTEKLHAARSAKLSSVLILLDLSAAFDTVNHKTLLSTLRSLGICGTAWEWFASYLDGRSYQEVQRFINQTWMQRYDRHISAELLTLLWSSIVSIFTIGGLVGASVGASLAVRFGRKGTLLINNSFALLAAVLMGLSSLTAAFELLIAGRFISGINAVNCWVEKHYWPLLLISPCVPAVLQLIFLPQFPESPRFLLIDRDDEVSCTAALKQLHGGEDFQVEMEDMQQERISAEGIEPKKPWQLFTECRNHWPLFIIIFISTAQQLNGINAIYFYAEYVFSEAGIPAGNIPYVTVGTGICECVTALTCSVLIERLSVCSFLIEWFV
ncbi:hypothetical protein QTP86_031269 [Hemibagrus guttatus]|nr:hypothetical protein QTP86_031269 [Hemibagrus guttatus]